MSNTRIKNPNMNSRCATTCNIYVHVLYSVITWMFSCLEANMFVLFWFTVATKCTCNRKIILLLTTLSFWHFIMWLVFEMNSYIPTSVKRWVRAVFYGLFYICSYVPLSPSVWFIASCHTALRPHGHPACCWPLLMAAWRYIAWRNHFVQMTVTWNSLRFISILFLALKMVQCNVFCFCLVCFVLLHV